MEKAYAQLVGGYDKAGAGGYAGDALEAITGEKAQNEALPAKDSVIERFSVTARWRAWESAWKRGGTAAGAKSFRNTRDRIARPSKGATV